MQTVLKYPGSKWSAAKWIISNFPTGYEKMTYCEPFFGSGAVFFNKKRSVIETINDLDNQVYNLFKVIRDNPEELSRLIQLTLWSRKEYKDSYEQTGNGLEDARRFLVRMWFAIGCKSSDTTGWRNNVQATNGNINQWATLLPERLVCVSERLKHIKGHLVQIENQNAFRLIERHRKSNVFIYADPTYVRSTRSGRIYKHEMNDEDHIRLLQLFIEHPGPVLLSGYESEIYNDLLSGWTKKCKDTRKESGIAATEILWMNYIPDGQQTLFDVG